MALSFSTDFTEKLNVNSQDRVVLCHLYYNDNSAYLAIATAPVVIGSVQYIGCLKDYSGLSETWNIGTDNMVTLAAPTIELAEYTDPNSYSLIEELNTKSIFGNRVVLLEGFDGLALSDFEPIFDGKIEDVTVNTGGLTLECIVSDPQLGWIDYGPDSQSTVISGGVIDAKSQKIGTTTISGITLNEKVDGKCVPVHFGKHWCAAGLCYEITDAGEINYIFSDPRWGDINPSSPQHAASTNGIKYLNRYNLNASSYRVLAKMDERLTPIFPTAYSGVVSIFSVGHDARIDYSSIYAAYVGFSGPDDCIQCLDDSSILTEVPIRPRALPGASHTLTGTGAAIGGDMQDGLDADASTYFTLSGTTGTITCTINTRVNTWEQLAHDSLGIVHRGREIAVPSGDVDVGDAGFWQTLILGRWKLTTNPGGGAYCYVELNTRWNGVMDTSSTRAGSPTATDSEYNYISLLYEQGVDGTWNAIDLSTDQVGPQWFSGIGDGGNYLADPESGELAFLGRKWFDNILREDIGLAIKAVVGGGGSIVGRFYDISLHVIEPIPLETDGYIYTDFEGFSCPTVETNLLTRHEGDTGTQLLDSPPQYLEIILKTRCGYTNANFNTAEWTYAGDWFDDFTESWREYSGLQLIEETKLGEFLREYLKYEPFTVFLDSSGVWRFKKLHRTLTDIQSNETIYTLDYDECDSLDMGLTPAERLCMEIKSMQTDYIPALDDYAVKRRWRLFDAGYDYGFWDMSNVFITNRFALDEVQCKYTSSPTCDRVKLNDVSWGCVKTHKNKDPEDYTTLRTQLFWQLLCEDLGAGTTWSSGATYRGEDCENRSIAEFYINQWCNRHRTVKFTSSDVKYKKHEIGDYVMFANVPETLLGMSIIGFGGEEDEHTVAVNGQDTYKFFLVTGVKKSMNSTTIECMQCHNLLQFRISEHGQLDDGI